MVIDENIVFYSLLFIVITLQTIVGVGILVLGTPLLLLLGYNIIEAISILLPISIFISLFNLLYIKFTTKEILPSIDRNTKKAFFSLCVPAVFFGIIFLKKFQDYINFHLLISVIIFITIGAKFYYREKIITFSKIKKKTILFFIGLIHGLTNSGGTLLSIFILNLNNNLKNPTRYSLSFFYFFLATLQYSIFIIFFTNKTEFPDLLPSLIPIAFFGIILGNFLTKQIQEKYFGYTIDALALFSAFFLIIYNL